MQITVRVNDGKSVNRQIVHLRCFSSLVSVRFCVSDLADVAANPSCR